MTPESTLVKFLVISDTHGAQKHSASLAKLPQADVVLHCGDLTENGTVKQVEEAIDWLGGIRAELKLCIAGNHEATVDRQFWAKQGGDADYHSRAIDALLGPQADQGVIFLTEGTYEFKLQSGAVFRIHASPFTPEFGVSAFQYHAWEDRYNPPEDPRPGWAVSATVEGSVIPNDVDIVMTHGPAKYILDETSNGGNAGCEHLRRAIARVKPKLHCFGHIHRSAGARRIHWPSSSATDIRLLSKEFVGRNQALQNGYSALPPSSAEDFRNAKGDQTLAINAAIIDSKGEPLNSPWLVELELPIRESAADINETRQRIKNGLKEAGL
jgi:3',5'-cyclic AMP phosphodiesterase CpdA